MSAVGRVAFVTGAASAVLGLTLGSLRRRPGGRPEAGEGEPTVAESTGDHRIEVRPAPERRVAEFFALVFALSVPFWVVGAVSGVEVLPGLPLSSFIWVLPALAAAVLVRADDGAAGVRDLLRRSVEVEGIRLAWLVPMLGLAPAAAVLSYVLQRASGQQLPPAGISLAGVLGLFAAFLVAAPFEELGWSAYATDGLLDRRGALGAALLIGALGAMWHWVPLLQAERTPGWIAWWSLGSISLRVLIAWLYLNTGGSVVAASVMHATYNVSWQAFPVRGSHFDPRFDSSLLLLAALAVTIVWGPRTLTRGRGR